MKEIQEKIINCNKCGNLPKLCEKSIQEGKTKFIIIGESPAKDGWIESKKAFFNTKGTLQATGRVLQKLLNHINLNIEDIYFTECCKCIIEDRKILEKCSSNCMPILIEQLNKLPCSIILTMGLHPTQALLKTKIKKFSDYVGKQFNIMLGGRNYLLIPIYHPSPLNPKGFKDNLPIFEMINKITQ